MAVWGKNPILFKTRDNHIRNDVNEITTYIVILLKAQLGDLEDRFGRTNHPDIVHFEPMFQYIGSQLGFPFTSGADKPVRVVRLNNPPDHLGQNIRRCYKLVPHYTL